MERQGWTACSCQIGSLKRAHHFGLNRTATLGEQLILQDSVTQSISSPAPSVLPVGAAAAAAGDKLLLPGCWGATWGTAWSASGWGLGSSRRNQSPDDEHPARARRRSSSIIPRCLISRPTFGCTACISWRRCSTSCVCSHSAGANATTAVTRCLLQW